MHELLGQKHPNYGIVTVLLAYDPFYRQSTLWSPHPVAGNLLIKTLIVCRWPTKLMDAYTRPFSSLYNTHRFHVDDLDEDVFEDLPIERLETGKYNLEGQVSPWHLLSLISISHHQDIWQTHHKCPVAKKKQHFLVQYRWGENKEHGWLMFAQQHLISQPLLLRKGENEILSVDV